MISIILPTNRINSKLLPKLQEMNSAIGTFHPMKTWIPSEFHTLIEERCKNLRHYLQPTLDSLEHQVYGDFELIISHRYPEDALDIVKEYSFPIKLVREKHSIWHDLGPQYGTLCNNINTAVIHSRGELLWRLDDLTFFNDYTLNEIYQNWQKERYITSPSIRCIEFNKEYIGKSSIEQIGPNKTRFIDNGWVGESKPIVHDNLMDRRIPISMGWGCSSTISIEDFLTLNGQDEVWDGSIDGTDMELGARLQRISNRGRVVTQNLVYELNDIPYKNMIRKDTQFRDIIGDYGTKANSWKPNERDIRSYKRWHQKNRGVPDPNWDQFLNVQFVDMNKEYKEKKLGEVIYDSTK
jgi:hypothetical protein